MILFNRVVHDGLDQKKLICGDMGNRNVHHVDSGGVLFFLMGDCGKRE